MIRRATCFFDLPRELRDEIYSHIPGPDIIKFIRDEDDILIRRDSWLALDKHGNTDLYSLLRSADGLIDHTGLPKVDPKWTDPYKSKIYLEWSMMERHEIQKLKTFLSLLDQFLRKRADDMHADLSPAQTNIVDHCRHILWAFRKVQQPITDFRNVSLACRQWRTEMTQFRIERVCCSFAIERLQLLDCISVGNIQGVKLSEVRKCLLKYTLKTPLSPSPFTQEISCVGAFVHKLQAARDIRVELSLTLDPWGPIRGDPVKEMFTEDIQHDLPNLRSFTLHIDFPYSCWRWNSKRKRYRCVNESVLCMTSSFREKVRYKWLWRKENSQGLQLAWTPDPMLRTLAHMYELMMGRVVIPCR